MKKVLVTGAKGFIGRNLVVALGRQPDIETISVDIGTPEKELTRGLDTCDVVFHLAGINRPLREQEYETGNVGSLATVLFGLEKRQRRPHIVFSSSAQALLNNPYGLSKRKAEELLFDYCYRTGSSASVFRLPGVFGRWCRPNYNSVVATFCHNIARDVPIQISDPSHEIELIYVGDVVQALIGLLPTKHEGAVFFAVAPAFRIKLGDLAKKLYEFRKSRETLATADLSDPFLQRLFGTYISYIPSEGFAYELERKADGHGQFFVSRTWPGITRGNHYHDTKVEKFLVLEGEGLIRFRSLATNERVEYKVSGHDFKVIDIPPGWTHSIQNVGNSEMIVLFWASEIFDAERPDTYPAEV
jgi:UDP-2-acetamido-2,6-beta-L-arabino-hexul-4-ose reductase